MAKKKAPKPKAQPWGESKPLAAQLRGSAEWKAWLEEFALTNEGDVPLRLLCCFPVGGQGRMPGGDPFTPPWAE